MVPPLSPETETEKRLFADAAKIQAARKAQRQAAKDPSKQAESAAARDEQIEALLKPGRVARDFPGQADEGFVLMHETSLKNAITTQPQVRNTAGRVFGGALMRYALELAFATAYAFSGCRSGVLFERRSALMAFRAGARRRRGPSRKSTSCGPWKSARCSP